MAQDSGNDDSPSSSPVEDGQFLSQNGEATERILPGTASVPPAHRAAVPSSHTLLPEKIDKYRIVSLLGEGASGVVYLATDSVLERTVAIKVERAQSIRAVDSYLKEARVLASLKHSGIPAVHDFGQMPDGTCYLVSEYVAGSPLSIALAERTLSLEDIARIVQRVAEALQHAHEEGIIHRDIKPSNILIEPGDCPRIIDFGIARKEEDPVTSLDLSGTPLYMSPEQASGEGHRIGPKSDIFSLGIVLYELLTGERPFSGDRYQVLDSVINQAIPSPRLKNPNIPEFLEQICLRAVARLQEERYRSASELAADLSLFLEHTNSKKQEGIPVVPKGLQSFDRNDSEFFIRLLPGPRDYEGLPNTIRFWKTRIENTEETSASRVGVIYGPSGCGKSSLVKAGLLPRLPARIAIIYLEAYGEETETQIAVGLRSRFPDIPENVGLAEIMANLRRGVYGGSASRILLVLDQFEQWLHTAQDRVDGSLARALRQCDGIRTQCIILVRDDFWLETSRFMRELGLGLAQNINAMFVDLFDEAHAKMVLREFGQAYLSSQPNRNQPSKGLDEFIDQAISDLLQARSIIPVQLALFAEMFRHRPWTPQELQKIGGVKGVGVRFLEESFQSENAPQRRRRHERAAKQLLASMLPENSAEIRKRIHLRSTLSQHAQYPIESEAFAELMEILVSELRLLTPAPLRTPMGSSQDQRFQLSHDYLIPTLRAWLSRDNRKTFRGRARLRLEERARLWSDRNDPQQLPTAWELINIHALTRSSDRTPIQARMLRIASRRHLKRAGSLIAIMALISMALLHTFLDARADALVARLIDADTKEIEAILEEIKEQKRRIDPKLLPALAHAKNDPRASLHLHLALWPSAPDGPQVLKARLLTANPEEIEIICRIIGPSSKSLHQSLRAALADSRSPPAQRLRAGCALALLGDFPDQNPHYVPQLTRWMVSENVLLVNAWANLIRSVHISGLHDSLGALAFGEESATTRQLALSIYLGAVEMKIEEIIPLIGQAQPNQIRLICNELDRSSTNGSSEIVSFFEANRNPPHTSNPESVDKWATKQSNYAIALLHRDPNSPVAWSSFIAQPDPHLRSFAIHTATEAQLNPETPISRLEHESDSGTKQALLLILAGMAQNHLTDSRKQELVPMLEREFRNDPDPGVHSAIEYLLKQWGRLSQLHTLKAELQSPLPTDSKNWYINQSGHTLSIPPAPEVYLMGSPSSEPGRNHNETSRLLEIPRRFAIGTTEITVSQFLEFSPTTEYRSDLSPLADCPINQVSFTNAMHYCRWLSIQEGIKESEQCYELVGKQLVTKTNYLELTGYRLPTEAEWEFSCRAGTTTARHFGFAEDLLPQYAWHVENAPSGTQPVGTLYPNTFGLFDVYGNVMEWCQDAYEEHESSPSIPIIDNGFTDSRSLRVARGSSFNTRAPALRSAYRISAFAKYPTSYMGFRIARTLPDP